MDVVIVRPMRDTTIKGHSEEERKAFANKAGAVLGGAYMQGSHVDMNYGSDGKVALEEAGLPVVEYIRCGGWEWIPDQSDEAAHLLCADGVIVQIEKGGKAVCTTVPLAEGAGFVVYAS